MADNTPSTELMWEEARRMLLRQEAVLDTLRTQAVALLSVTSIVAGLFGSRLLPDHHPARVVVAITVALVLFAGSAVLAIVILLPREWDFSHSLTKPLARVKARDPLAPINVMYSWAATFEIMRGDNQKKLNCLMRCFWWACILAGLQVVAWGIAVI